MNSKNDNKLTTVNTEPKKQKLILSKQLEQEQNQRNGGNMEGYQWGGVGGKWGEKVQGLRSITGGHKVDRGRLRVV